MYWDHAHAFLAVVREGSLTGAARALGLAQPTVRRRIEELKSELGGALFTRTPAGLAPTETALALRGHAEAMEMAAEAMTRTASASANEMAGVVRVSASEVIAVEVLPPIFGSLRAAHPRLVIALSPTNRNEDLLRREADVAVRMTQPLQEALVARRIGAIELGLYAHRDYLARIGAPTTIEDVLRAGLIGPEHDNAMLRAMRVKGAGLTPSDFAFRTDSDLAHLAAIRAGVGIGVCQAPLAARDPSLVRLLADEVHFDLETWVVTHEDLHGVARIRAVFDALVEGLIAYRTAARRAAAALPFGGK